MAEIIPFKGIHYNPEFVQDLGYVVTPPFDVINEKQQQDYHERHPLNFIRLILGKIPHGENTTHQRHKRAGALFRNWLSENVLVQDEKTALYLTSMTFELDGENYTRFGFIGLVGLVPFEKKVVLPHEKTFSNVKADRLELMKECNANFSPIFSLFPEGNEIISYLKTQVDENRPEMEFTDISNIYHRLWRITDPDVHEYVQDKMDPKRIFIADGHHRYETALAYRKWLEETGGDIPPEHPANYVMMYLCSMEDPGVIILPAHRLLRQISPSRLDGLVENARKYFDMESIPFDPGAPSRFVSRIREGLETDPYRCTIGVLRKNDDRLYLLSLKPGIMDSMFGEKLPESLRHIDVTVLTRLVLMEILGFDQVLLDNEKMIGYSSRIEDAVEYVQTKVYDVAFILNPTRIDQVKKIATEGQIMPRKATYFYPKVISGQLVNLLSPDGRYPH